MDRVTLQNYRCFREEQSARLAPLTFLVGENSTGKTSFLALLRALWQIAFRNRIPDFRQPPYDLGGFDDIVHHHGGRNKVPESFEVAFDLFPQPDSDPITHRVTFNDRQGHAFPSVTKFSYQGTWVEINSLSDGEFLVRIGSGPKELNRSYSFYDQQLFLLLPFSLAPLDNFLRNHDKPDEAVAVTGKLDDGIDEWDSYESEHEIITPFASAPIRSRPRRTYDPSRPTQDPEGEYIPDYFASMSRNEPEDWERLKSDLEDFGRDSGLFDEIAVLSFGKTAGSPFQAQIRKFGKRLKGPRRNLIDVGYGVSQALPILTELLREDSPKMFLLQQPEVHLHPRAQAALGSLFCNLAASGKQIIVETHSDYIIDRSRMDIRDGKTGLKPDDISILYFERDELDANIHSLGIDEEGNVLDAPPGYGQFFMDEMRRSVGL